MMEILDKIEETEIQQTGEERQDCGASEEIVIRSGPPLRRPSCFFAKQEQKQ